MNNSPIVIVEDDKEESRLLVDIFHQIGVKNPFRCFEHPAAAINYLGNTSEVPFIIISDINLPGMDRLAFKRVINEDAGLLNKKIPFIFLSASKANSMIDQAFNLSVQGYFRRPNNVESLKEIAKAIVEYWKGSHFLFVEKPLNGFVRQAYSASAPVSIRPLTRSMHVILREALYREDTKHSPLGIKHSQQCKGLVSRGLMLFDTYTVNGKAFMGFHLTQDGRDYLMGFHSTSYGRSLSNQ